MTLDDLEQVGIVVGEIADAALGNQFIACVGKVTRGGIKSDDGQHWMGATPLQAAMRCYKESDVLK
ncbi:hypothetical protein R8871_04029 [Paraburkholderia graminis C4D1M]|uniref:Uncharacterized protein n=1 Tax=Paraburkholderia graminis (strain ATCC 700544 / DSM 17151 / LMG 18924 / NCIMB 13744 / C4D1M) TaxID=396598 RepID=B1G6S9_PARG4|nr:hypothetical protein [Paraburkholderia graminis]EDT08149.1 hypothetical protein BgramDRAFT_5075 [Paraburkholderia graminis C4D1M]CAB3709094.1 hypothetical protein R8871_04029 [Paraburkholderia graminis C4D1M]